MMQNKINQINYFYLQDWFRQDFVRVVVSLGALSVMSLFAASHAVAAPEKSSGSDSVDWKQSGAVEVANRFIEQLKTGRFAQAYQSGAPTMRDPQKGRDLAAFTRDMQAIECTSFGQPTWNNGIPVQQGWRLDGTIHLDDARTLPVFATVVNEDGTFKVLDLASRQSAFGRIRSGAATMVDWFLVIVLLAVALALSYIIVSYVRGLKGSPRELYLMFFTKVTEYSAYGAANLVFVLYLHNDVGLSDLAAGSYIGTWSVGLSVTAMFVGAICDAIGIKKTLLFGCYALLVSRFFMPFLDNIVATSLLGFLPLAIGIAITTPVLSVGIKRYTTTEGTALGFGLFYTLMNVGYAIGAQIFDSVRGVFGDNQLHSLPFFGLEISTYQIIIGVGFLLTLPDLIAIAFMRDGVEMTDSGVRITPQKTLSTQENAIRGLTVFFSNAVKETLRIFRAVIRERIFWLFIFMIAIVIFVRLTFYHFHYTFPTYGIRVFGEGVKIGSIFGVLNPVLIVFLVPLISAMTRRVRSYKMLLIGTAVSSGAVFIAIIPPEIFSPLIDSWFGELVYQRWLEIPYGRRDPFYLSLVVFIAVFTIGEAIWSPRLMQFTAEIAPPNREGTYIAMANLPFFLAKLIAGPMSGWLITTYTPAGAASYPNHFMVWIWIGLMAAVSPIGLFVFRRIFVSAEARAIEYKKSVAT